MRLADRYREWLRDDGFREDESLRPGRKLPLLELQARWFAEEFGREVRTVDGDPVDVLDFGEWNRDAGPVFSNALISIRGQRPVRGGIHIAANARDWEACMARPEYQETILFAHGGEDRFRTTTADGWEVPQVRLDTSRFEFAGLSSD